MPLIDEKAAIRVIQRAVPDWAWLLGMLESEKGHFRFPRRFADYICDLRIQSYPRLYENEAAIGLMALRGFFTEAEIHALNAELENLSPLERGEALIATLDDFEDLGELIEIPRTVAEQQRAQVAFSALSKEDQERAVKVWQHVMSGFLAGFHQTLSVAVHGVKLSTLVAHAKSGDDRALAKAVQIDKRTLTEIPYFRDRWARAQTEGDDVLLRDVGQKLSRPPYVGRIRHKELYLALSFLESAGLLANIRHQDLLDLLDAAGIGLHKNRIEDLKNLSRRLAEYRRFQNGKDALSTPSKSR